ncbi:UNKNOWN [Stylonychia lemnae]|uniref:Uncharacterized protein n=1 Tax=Stylonychia lemnae TaxID=5949 RepID=A0A078A9C9_STYLE|nr:UNKNOWN [Stylonychia lemnae]|eukprot:CDW78870.1 UNKNOWN [Stylonychia lemnae]
MSYLVAFHVNQKHQNKVKSEFNAQVVQMDYIFSQGKAPTQILVSALLTAKSLTNPLSMGVAPIANLAIKNMDARFAQEKFSRKIGQQQLLIMIKICNKVHLKHAKVFFEITTILECKSGYECQKCSKDDITKCTQCNHPTNQKSLLTENTENPCTSQIDVCLDVTSEQNCKTCIYGYSIFTDDNGNQKCLKCENDSLNTESIIIRCNFSVNALTGLPQQEQITACLDGFFDPLKNTCTTNCGIGRYGQVTFNDRGMIDSAICNACDDNCFECATKSECSSCKKGFYLFTSSNQVTTGQCLKKSGTAEFTLYVDSIFGRHTTNETTGMTLDDPFYSLQSAISKAYEYGAIYEKSVIKIILVSGKTHSMLRYYDNILLPRAYDQNSQTTTIKIDTTDKTQVKVLYKLRDKYTFLVGGGLEIRNIEFDAIDSIIDSRYTNLNITLLSSNEYACLEDLFSNCCRFQKDDSSGKYVVSGPDFCYLKILPNDQCHLPIGGSLIQFDISSQTSLASPQNVRFENFIYDFNTIIELNDFGGHISLINTSFININSCGSVIRNKRFDHVYNYLQQGFILQKMLDSFELLKSKLPESDIFQNLCGQSMNIPCFSLNISGGTVKDFGKMINFSQAQLWVNPQLKLKNLGQFLDIDNFQGPVIIQNVDFTSNLAVNLDYDLSKKILQNDQSELDQYQKYGDKSAIQIRSLVSIVNHGEYKVEILNNQFILNSGTKGILYLDLNHRREDSKLLIQLNQFNNNFGMIQSNALYIRARGLVDKDVYQQSLDIQQDNCLGYEIKNNIFNKNFGFQGISGGPIYFECTNYQIQEDVSGFIELTQFQETIDEIHGSLNLNSLELENYSLTLDGNTYIDNSASKQNGIVNIINVKKLKILNEVYINNTDAFFQKSTILAKNILQEYMPQDTNEEINITGIDFDSNLAKSLINIQRSRYVFINSINFDSNYLIEPDSSYNRAQAIYFTDIMAACQVQFKQILTHINQEIVAMTIGIQKIQLLDRILLPASVAYQAFR